MNRNLIDSHRHEISIPCCCEGNIRSSRDHHVVKRIVKPILSTLDTKIKGFGNSFNVDIKSLQCSISCSYTNRRKVDLCNDNVFVKLDHHALANIEIRNLASRETGILNFAVVQRMVNAKVTATTNVCQKTTLRITTEQSLASRFEDSTTFFGLYVLGSKDLNKGHGNFSFPVLRHLSIRRPDLPSCWVIVDVPSIKGVIVYKFERNQLSRNWSRPKRNQGHKQTGY